MGLETAGIIALAAGSAASGIAGAAANMSAQDRAKLLQDQGVQQWLSVNIPDPAQQKLALNQFVQAGTIAPSLQTAVKQADSQLQSIKTNPALQNTRLRALSSLEQQGYGGEQVQDTAAREKALIDSGAAARGQQQQILGSLARRGQLGTGLELTGRLDAAQGNANNLASNALDIEAARRNRALQAVQGAGNLAGDIQNQQFGQQAQQASAQDAINRFNAANAQGVNAANAQASQAANLYNLQNAQNVANQNTQTQNYQQEYNSKLLQQQFANQAAKAAGLTGQYNNQANTAIQSGQNLGNMFGGISSGLGKIAYGVGSQNNGSGNTSGGSGNKSLLAGEPDQQQDEAYV